MDRVYSNVLDVLINIKAMNLYLHVINLHTLTR